MFSVVQLLVNKIIFFFYNFQHGFLMCTSDTHTYDPIGCSATFFPISAVLKTGI